MGKIDDEKDKLVKERESLESDLALAEEATAAGFSQVTEADISSGVDPSDGPGEPIITERTGESIETYCPECRQSWSDNPNTRKNELLKILHKAEVHDYPDPKDIFNALQFENTQRYACPHGSFRVYARCKEEVENRLTVEVSKLLRYRAKIRKAIKALESAPPPKDDTIWGHI